MIHEIFGVRLDDVSGVELDTLLDAWIAGETVRVIATPNPEFLLLARRQPVFRDLLNASDLSLPDGVGLRYAVAALSDRRLAHRHAGTDTLVTLAQISAAHQKRLALIGGEQGTAERTAIELRKRLPSLDVVALDPGVVRGDAVAVSAHDVATEKLRELQPTVLAVALGAGKQERFIRDVLPALPSVRIAIGVGGAFDMLSGRLPRAPQTLRRIGLEWVWRLRLEPRRIRRIANAVIVFPIVVAWGTLKSRRFLRACRNVFPEILAQLRGL